MNEQKSMFDEVEVVEEETKVKVEEKTSKKKEKDERSFEENITLLESIVKELETGSCSLDTAIEKFTEGMHLAKLCGEKLSNATEKVNKILTENGTLEDFETPTE